MRGKNIIFIILLILIVSCTGDNNPVNNNEASYNYELSYQFKIIGKYIPVDFAFDNENEFIYIAGGEEGYYSSDKNPKFQKYNYDGVLLSTLNDFNYNHYGVYPRYELFDITLDDYNNVCLLLLPYMENSDSPGFCIMCFNSNGQFLEEIDFSKYKIKSSKYDFGLMHVITFKNNTYYLSNGIDLFKIPRHTNKIIRKVLPERPMFITDMIVDSDENIWCAGTINTGRAYYNSIAQWDSDLKLQLEIKSFSYYAESSAIWNRPKITLDEKNNIFLATCKTNRLEIFNNSTRKMLGSYDFSKINKYGYLTDIGIDKANRIYVMDSQNKIMYVLKSKNL